MLEIYEAGLCAQPWIVCADCLFHNETGNHSEWNQAFHPEELDASTDWCEGCGTRLAGPRFQAEVSVEAEE